MNKRALVKEYAEKHRYFTLEEMAKAAGISNQLAKNYLQALKQNKIIFSAIMLDLTMLLSVHI